jgi:CHAT domain
VLTARLNQAEIWIALNQTFAAETELNAAEHLALSLGDARSARRIGLLRETAAARRLSDEGAVALAPSVRVMQESRRRSRRHDRSAAPAPAVRNPPGQADGFWARFEQRAEEIVALARRGALSELEGRAALMKSAFGTTDSPLLRARLRFLDGVIDESRANHEAAIAAYQAAADEFRRMGARMDLWRAERRLARLAAADPVAKGPDWASADATLRAIADTLPSEARAIFLLDKSDAEEEACRTEILALASRNAEARQTPFWRRLLRSRAVCRDLLAFLDRLDAQREGALGTAAAPMRLRDLPRRSITVVFLSLPHFLFIAALSPRGAAFEIRPVSRLALRDWLAEWHLSARATIRSEAGSSLHRLAEAIRLDELVARVGGRRDQLRIVADDVLHGAPFAAFPFEGGQLVERRGLSLAQSIRPLRRPRVVADRRAAGLLIGIAQGGPGFPPLANVPEEMARVAQWMGRAGRAPVQLRDHQATRDTVTANLAQANLAHIACHGAFEADRVDASGLVVGPHLDPPQILTIRELQRLDLSALSHVTLSACWAADNYILPGRQVLSLPGCLVRAGAGTVLACLWLVSDESALPFIARFYELAERRRRVDALRLAQLEALDGRIPGAEDLNLSSPYFWAGFTLYGEDCRRSLALPRLGLRSWLPWIVRDGFRGQKVPAAARV